MVVFMTTIFALGSGVSPGYAALVIVQAGTFADASRMLVRSVALFDFFRYMPWCLCPRAEFLLKWSSTSTRSNV